MSYYCLSRQSLFSLKEYKLSLFIENQSQPRTDRRGLHGPRGRPGQRIRDDFSNAPGQARPRRRMRCDFSNRPGRQMRSSFSNGPSRQKRNKFSDGQPTKTGRRIILCDSPGLQNKDEVFITTKFCTMKVYLITITGKR